MMLLVSTLFGSGNSIASRLAVGEISPMTLTASRWAIVLAVLWCVRARRHTGRRRPASGAVAHDPADGSVHATYYAAGHMTSALNMSILQGAMPIMVMIGALAVHRTRVRPGQAFGALLPTAGVAIVAVHGDLHTLMKLKLNAATC